MYECIVCGYVGLEYPQRDELGYATQCICPCCGFQSGFHDDAMDEPMKIEQYRDLWISEGAKWSSNSRKQPQNWNLEGQLKGISLNIDLSKHFC